MNAATVRSLYLIILTASWLDASAVTWMETAKTAIPMTGVDAIAAAEYSFQNTSGKSVRVLSVQPGCDCVSARADKEVYAAGERGVLRVEYRLAGKEGRQTTTIAVRTDAAPDHPTLLTLVAEIPEPVRVTPRVLFWRLDEPGTEKEFEVVLDGSGKAKVTDLQIANPTFTGRLLAGPSPQRFRLVVAPVRTSELSQATIRLNAIVDGRPEVVVLQAAVK